MSNRFELKIDGVDEMRRQLSIIISRYPEAVRGALKRWAEKVKTDSVEHYVPTDKGTLKNSARTTLTPRRLQVNISFGGQAKDYAIVVHEHPSAFSPGSWKNGVHFTTGGPKYLERPLLAAVSTAARDIAKDMNLEGLLR